MKTSVLIIVSLLTTLIAYITPLYADRAGPGDFYVAPNGNDTNPGTFDRPFATIQRAQQAVRRKIKQEPNQPVTVYIRGGLYELSQPLVFTPKDSGTTQACISYVAWPGEVPRFSGGRIITGWKKGKNNLWTVTLPRVANGQWYFRQLFAAGKRLPRSRFPAQGLLHITQVTPDAKTLTFDRNIPGTIGGRDAELIVIQNWSIARAIIASAQAKTITCKTPLGWVGHSATTASPGKPAYLENASEFPLQTGQWYLDRRLGILSYQAAAGENPNQMQFTAPFLSELLVIRGTPTTPVRNLFFKGLVFEYAAWLLPKKGYAGIQAGYNNTTKIPDDVPEEALPVSVKLLYSRDCLLKNCRFIHLGPSGIGLSAGTRRNRILACEIRDIGGNGIHIGWPNKPIPVLDKDWDNPEDVPTDNEISNCYVHHCGAENFGSVGIFAAFSANTSIRHNHVCFMPYTGVSIGFRWNSTPTSQKHCRVQYNHIHDVMLKLADGGGIYTLGWQPGTILRGNLIYNIFRSSYAHGGAPNNGIFFDEGSKGFLIEENIIYDTSGNPVRFNRNRKEGHTWRNNYFGVRPTNNIFPHSLAEYAGIETRYKDFFSKGIK